jgi:hypothetical protein
VVVLGVGPVGIWWMWSRERSGGSAPLVSKVMLGIGLFVVVSAIAGGLRRLPDAVTGVVTLIFVGGAVIGFLAINEWAGSQSGRAVRVLGPVCNGRGVPAALGLQGPGPFHAVVVGNHGQEIDWSEHAAAWRRVGSVRDTELVACVQRERERELIETCLYQSVQNPTAKYEVKRYSMAASVRVLEARSARVVDRFTVTSEPPACPQERKSTNSIATAVTFQQFSARLVPFVARTG